MVAYSLSFKFFFSQVEIFELVLIHFFINFPVYCCDSHKVRRKTARQSLTNPVIYLFYYIYRYITDLFNILMYAIRYLICFVFFIDYYSL